MFPTDDYITIRKAIASNCMFALKSAVRLVTELEETEGATPAGWASLVVGALETACKIAYSRFVFNGVVRLDSTFTGGDRWEYFVRVMCEVDGGEDIELTYVIQPAFLTGYEVHQL